MLTNVHGPFDQRIFFKEARSLAAAGYEVTLIAPGAPGTVAVRDGVRIETIPQPRGIIGRCVNLLRLFAAGLGRRCELYHLHDPELLPMGLVLRLLRRQVIYDVHEHFPQVVHVRCWIPDFLRRPLSRLVDRFERTAACCLNAVVGVVDEQRDRFDHCPFAAVKNFPRLECFPAIQQRVDQEAPRLIHLGSLSVERGGLFLLDVMKHLRETHPAARLLCVGSFHTEQTRVRFNQMLSDYSLDDRVTVRTERVDYEDLAKTMSGSAVGLIPGQISVQNLFPFVPTKLFEYMACGIPVVASALPSLRSFYRSGDWGELVAPDDAGAHAAAIGRLLDHPEMARAKGERGRQLVEQQYNWDREAEKLLILYSILAGRDRSEGTASQTQVAVAESHELAPGPIEPVAAGERRVNA